MKEVRESAYTAGEIVAAGATGRAMQRGALAKI